MCHLGPCPWLTAITDITWTEKVPWQSLTFLLVIIEAMEIKLVHMVKKGVVPISIFTWEYVHTYLGEFYIIHTLNL